MAALRPGGITQKGDSSLKGFSASARRLAASERDSARAAPSERPTRNEKKLAKRPSAMHN